jgi:hypothetical protein
VACPNRAQAAEAGRSQDAEVGAGTSSAPALEVESLARPRPPVLELLGFCATLFVFLAAAVWF